jgi:hypothetical protein
VGARISDELRGDRYGSTFERFRAAARCRLCPPEAKSGPLAFMSRRPVLASVPFFFDYGLLRFAASVFATAAWMSVQ